MMTKKITNIKLQKELHVLRGRYRTGRLNSMFSLLWCISFAIAHYIILTPQDIAVWSNLIGSLFVEYDAILYTFTTLFGNCTFSN